MRTEVQLNTGGLDRLIENMKALEGERKVPLSELLSDAFIAQETPAYSYAQLRDAVGVDILNLPTADDLHACEALRDYLVKNTRHGSVEGFLRAAGKFWINAQIRKGVA